LVSVNEEEIVMKGLKILGVVLAAIQFILSCIVIYQVMSTKMISTKVGVIVAVILLIFPILEVLLLKFKGGTVVSIVIALMFSAVLIYGMYLLKNTTDALNELTGTIYQTEEVNVYVKADDPVDSINEAVEQSYTFGIIKDYATSTSSSAEQDDVVQNTIDEINSEYQTAITTVSYDSILELVQGLEAGDVQSLIVNEAMISALESIEGYESYSDNLKIILEKEVEVEVVVDDDDEESDDTFLVYISGIDSYGSVNVKSRSDVNIIAAVNVSTHQVTLISTPRDYYINLPAVGNAKDKLTHAGIYGIDASIDALEQLYDTNIKYYVRMNFSGFKNIVDALGGIDVESDYAFTYYDENGNAYSYSVGTNHLDGTEALGFARERHAFTDGDRQRGRNQMKVIQGVLTKLMSADILKNYASLMESISSSLQTNMTLDEIGALVQGQLESGASWNIVTYSVSGSDSTQKCASIGMSAYVMIPNENDVEFAKELIIATQSGTEVTQDEINAYLEGREVDVIDSSLVDPEEDTEESTEEAED